MKNNHESIIKTNKSDLFSLLRRLPGEVELHNVCLMFLYSGTWECPYYHHWNCSGLPNLGCSLCLTLEHCSGIPSAYQHS